MKIKKFILISISFFCLMLTTQAKDITLQDIYQELKKEESNVTNDIYNSTVNFADNKISITYTFKDNASSSSYLDPKEFYTRITEEDNIIVYLTGFHYIQEKYENGLNLNEQQQQWEEFLQQLKNINTDNISEMENNWHDKLVNIINELSNNNFPTAIDYCDPLQGMCTHILPTNHTYSDIYSAKHYETKFRLNNKFAEATNITSNSATITVYPISLSNVPSVPYPGYETNIPGYKDISSQKVTSINLTNLQPNTTYEYTIKTYDNDNFYTIKLTTLANPVTQDNTSNTQTNKENDKNIENPNTGAKIPIISGCILLLSALLLFKLSKKNKKLF